jgi:hypothetical protein
MDRSGGGAGSTVSIGIFSRGRRVNPESSFSMLG